MAGVLRLQALGLLAPFIGSDFARAVHRLWLCWLPLRLQALLPAPTSAVSLGPCLCSRCACRPAACCAVMLGACSAPAPHSHCCCLRCPCPPACFLLTLLPASSLPSCPQMNLDERCGAAPDSECMILLS